MNRNCPRCDLQPITRRGVIKNDELEKVINQFYKLEDAFKADTQLNSEFILLEMFFFTIEFYVFQLSTQIRVSNLDIGKKNYIHRKKNWEIKLEISIRLIYTL